MTRRTHQNDADVAELLGQGLTQRQVADRLGMSQSAVSRARIRIGLPPRLVSADSLEDAWRAHTEPTPDGHLLWTGPHGVRGQRIFKHHNRQYTAGPVAFRIGHGREPQGHVLIACGLPDCIHPGHTEDTAMRQRTHTMLRVLQGSGAPSDTCSNGHDRAAHGFVGGDGYMRCRECARERRTAARTAEAA